LRTDKQASNQASKQADNLCLQDSSLREREYAQDHPQKDEVLLYAKICVMIKYEYGKGSLQELILEVLLF
jgi:hypothetical protein